MSRLPMETKRTRSAAHCTQHPILTPRQLSVLFDILIGHIREQCLGPNSPRRPDWDICVEKYNRRFPRANLTEAMMRCALKGKRSAFHAALAREPPIEGFSVSHFSLRSWELRWWLCYLCEDVRFLDFNKWGPFRVDYAYRVSLAWLRDNSGFWNTSREWTLPRHVSGLNV